MARKAKLPGARWDKIDTEIITRIARRITDQTIAARAVDVALKESHWPRHLYEPSQKWVGSLNS